MRRFVFFSLLAACACSSSGGPETIEAMKPGLQYSGAIATNALQQISAPILPNSIVWQYKGGSGYPASLAEAQALVRDTTYTYGYLLAECAETYPEITLASDSYALDEARLQANYSAVARCAYEEKYGAKPYWMPQILDDVDVCALKLGPAWRLPTEADLDRLSEADYQLFERTMSGEEAWAHFYFSLDIYVRGRDGSLKWGILSPGATQHVVPLPSLFGGPTELITDPAIGVRCIYAP